MTVLNNPVGNNKTYYEMGEDQQKRLDEFASKHSSKLEEKYFLELYAKELLLIEEELLLKEQKAKKLNEELIQLKKRELWRKYTSLVCMVPFAALMAIELEAVCSSWVLLGLTRGVLGHLILPFSIISCFCAVYLLYNNYQMKKKEQELRSVESGEIIGENNTSYDKEDCVNYIDAVATTLLVIGGILSESSQGTAENMTYLISNIIGFGISLAFYYIECKKEQENPDLNKKSEGKTSNISAAQLMLAGSSILLIRRIMLMTLSLHPAIGPALGLAGIMCVMVGYALTIRSYSRELKDAKATGKGVSSVMCVTTANNCKGGDNVCGVA